MPRADARQDFGAVFDALRAILVPYAKKMKVVHDTDSSYYVDTRYTIVRNKAPLFFAAVRKGKAYVSFHLMPVYCDRALIELIPPALRKRMQGKACFNFKEVDKAVFAELQALTREAAERFTPERLRKIGIEVVE